MREIDGWIRQGRGEDGRTLSPETCPHRVLFMVMMNEIPISSKGPKRGTSLFLQDTDRNAAHFEKFKPGYFMYIGPGSGKTWHFEKYFDDPKGKWDELAKQVTNVYSVQKHPILKGCLNFQRRILKKCSENMHFDAMDPSLMMMMDLIRSANDIRLVFGICVYLGKINEIDI